VFAFDEPGLQRDAATVDVSDDSPDGSLEHDEDQDGFGDSADTCPTVATDGMSTDSDDDGIGDPCDATPTVAQARALFLSFEQRHQPTEILAQNASFHDDAAYLDSGISGNGSIQTKASYRVERAEIVVESLGSSGGAVQLVTPLVRCELEVDGTGSVLTIDVGTASDRIRVSAAKINRLRLTHVGATSTCSLDDFSVSIAVPAPSGPVSAVSQTSTPDFALRSLLIDGSQM
jgi:hypothetical protein